MSLVKSQGSTPQEQDQCDDALCDAAGVHGGWITVGVRQIFCDYEEECDDGNPAP